MRARWLVASLVVLAGIGVVRVLAAVQAPNQAQLVMQTVAGVKFGTLPGFAIERVNPADKTDSYVVLTFDSQGRPVVSKENDHPRLLLDNDKDGMFESEKVITDKVRNCQGLWFDGPTLYARVPMRRPSRLRHRLRRTPRRAAGGRVDAAVRRPPRGCIG